MLIDEVAEYLNQTIIIEPYASQDVYGEPSYGAAVSYDCRIELKNRMVRDALGQERVSRGRIYVNTQTVVSTKDRLTLPSGYSPSNPEILSVYPVQGESGTDHIVISIG